MLVGGGERPRVASRIEGKGWKLGITLRPAMFQALLGASMASITDRVLPRGDLLGPRGEVAVWMRAIAGTRALDARIAIAEAFLEPPPGARSSASSARWSARARSGLSSAIACTRLQRSSRAATRPRSPRSPPRRLAASLGYADQAHFTRDFKRMVGETPRSFRICATHRT